MPVESETIIDSTDTFISIFPTFPGNPKIHLNARLTEVNKKIKQFQSCHLI